MPLVFAEIQQLDQVMDVYDHVVKVMNDHGNFQWGNGYPSKEIIKEDIEKKELYLLSEKDEITAAVVLNRDCEPEYQHIQWKDDYSFIVIHRLCVNPNFQGKGVGRVLMEEIEKLALDQGYTSIRLDTFSQNKKAQSLFARQGYEPRGIFYFSGYDDPFIAFEKQLS